MLHWIVAYSLVRAPQLLPEGAVIAPMDIVQGHQVIDLRAPLIARSSGTRLVLFVRDACGVTDADRVTCEAERLQAFQAAVPAGSVTAHLTAADGTSLTLEHTGYRYYQGFPGLVLTEKTPGTRTTRYAHMELDASVALPRVRFVWLDQLTRTVRDVPPPN